MNSKHIINSILATSGTILTYLIGNWDNNIQILLTLIICDYITGVMKGYKNKNLSSSIGVKGIYKKAAIFIVIILAHQIDTMSGLNTPISKTMSIYFYIVNEGLSIIENLKYLGVPLPKYITKALKEIQEDGEFDEEKLG